MYHHVELPRTRMPKRRNNRRRKRRRNRRNRIPVNTSSEISGYPIYPYDFSSAPLIFSAPFQGNFPVISQPNPSNPMAPSVPTLPSRIPPTTRTVETTGHGMRIQISNTVAEPPVEDDVVYLYSVSGGQLVEVVDLAEEEEIQGSNSTTRNFIVSTERSTVRENTAHQNLSILPEMIERDIDVICTSNTTKETTKKPVVSAVESKKRKRSTGEARCIICEWNYERITTGGGELFSSRCGHLFCMLCLKNLQPYKCTECNSKISNLWKIYL